jgi:hypothetical protein
MNPRRSWLSLMRLLCLLAALAGSPLRQAEAAEDFAHSLGELGQAYSIEEKDGGVGDDLGSTITRASGVAAPADGLAWLALDVMVLGHVPAPCVRGFDRPPRASPRVSGPAGEEGKHAWLQRFRF